METSPQHRKFEGFQWVYPAGYAGGPEKVGKPMEDALGSAQRYIQGLYKLVETHFKGVQEDAPASAGAAASKPTLSEDVQGLLQGLQEFAARTNETFRDRVYADLAKKGKSCWCVNRPAKPGFKKACRTGGSRWDGSGSQYVLVQGDDAVSPQDLRALVEDLTVVHGKATEAEMSTVAPALKGGEVALGNLFMELKLKDAPHVF